MKQKGFTLVELLVVIAVIGILATISLVSYRGVQAKARDTERKTEVQAIADAIKLYRLKNGNDIDTGSGCGGNGSGTGWFAYETGVAPYTKSIMTCLKEAKYLDGDMIDPSNCVTSSVAAPGKTCKPTGYTYMKYTCDYQGQRVSAVYARLETEDHTSDLDNFDGNAANSTDTCKSIFVQTYNMNYMVLVD
ncbi:MAG TPA: type II secretion system protein [Candidatus Saccharimonadales bacterium]